MRIDPTFNLGEFVVTPIVYNNLKLIHRRTGDCQTFLGSVRMHQTKTESSFDFFVSSIVSLRNTLDNILFSGTDDECSIFNSLSRYMPISKNLQCKRHVRLNLKRKLHTLGINDPYTNQFNNAIFYKNVGLADCLIENDFENKLLELKPVWNLRECEARNSTKAEFYPSFLRYKKDLVQNCLSLPLRISLV
jgi:hypothetical protein